MNTYLTSLKRDSTTWMQAFDAFESTYVNGARTVGLPSDVLPEIEYSVSVDIVSSTTPGSPPPQLGAAHVIASRYVSKYPTSSRAHITLGEVLLKQRDTTRARAAFTRAVALAQGSDTTALRMATGLLAGLGAAR